MKIALQKYMHLADGKDMVPAIRAALADCQPGDTLCLGGGLLHLYPEHTAVRPYYVSNNDYSEKHIAFDLQNRRDLTIDGEGAELLFHGHVTPFVLDNAENITIRNLHVDYRNPFFIQARITDAGEDFTELTFDGDTFACRLKDGKLCFYSPEDGWESVEEKVLVTEFDDNGRPSPYLGPYFTVLTPQEESFLSGMYRYFDAEQAGENTIRLHGRIGYTHTVGNWWVCTFGGRHNPGIFITDSQNITLCDLELYHTAAMGVIGQCSENITLERVNCRVRPVPAPAECCPSAPMPPTLSTAAERFPLRTVPLPPCWMMPGTSTGSIPLYRKKRTNIRCFCATGIPSSGASICTVRETKSGL